ncbi:MAG TPA: DUF4105 domain-containing protein [Candidatus Nitrosotalea sp.]|nr:DUF4105 domain-containing protein [Candidatus Nitrosotalea sp.]
MRRLLIGTARWLVVLAALGITGWGALALAIVGPGGDTGRLVLAAVYGLAGLAAAIALVMRRGVRVALPVFAVALVAIGLWWNSLKPSNERDWQPEVAKLAYATINGDLVTVHNIRNFDYRTETDFTPAYYDKTFDVTKLDSVDLVAVYWMGPAIAHLLLSFGFGDDHLAISIEARKEKGEGYSSAKGFFRQYELYYVVADERDVIRVRTNYRKDPPEDVYIYRVVGPPENGRRVFLEYMRRLNRLREHPEFYNTLTTNCTTAILTNTRVNPESLPFTWKVLLSGYTPAYVYESGRLDRSLPFEELQRRSLVNAAGKAADQAPDFSRRIRAGLPGAAGR